MAGDPDVASWNVVGYPKPLTVMQQIMAQLGGKSTNPEEIVENVLEGTPMEGIAKSLLDWKNTWTKGNGQLMFARLPFEIEIR